MTTLCTIGAELRAAWWSYSAALVNRLREQQPDSQKVIDLRDADPEYKRLKAAWIDHVAECRKCQKHLRR